MDYTFPKQTFNPVANPTFTQDVGEILKDYGEYGLFIKDGNIIEIAYDRFFYLVCHRCRGKCVHMEKLNVRVYYCKEGLIFELLKNGYLYIFKHLYTDSNDNRILY